MITDSKRVPMEKLIITVACDSRTSYPHNHLCPPQEDIPGVAQQYIDAVNAGAAIAHIHGRRTLEETIQADGRQVYLRDQTYVTLFIGWPGGTWTPPTERALQFMVDNLPRDCIWNVSVMNPQKQWPILALAVALGGHVRVGYEDNPYIAPGEFAKNNAILVERMASIARGLGREIATPDEARNILCLTRPQ